MDIELLKKKLSAIDDQDYGAYQFLLGEYKYPGFKLTIKQIPKDPFAPPHTGIYCALIDFEKLYIPQELNLSKIKQIAFCDFLARNFFKTSEKISKVRRGTGYSGIITLAKPGQVILERSSIILKENAIEVRFFIGLPADGRKIRGNIAEEMFFKELPEIIEHSFFQENFNRNDLNNHIEIAEDGEALREQLDSLDLISFIGNDSILPRESGTSDKPLKENQVIPFQAPDSLKVEINLPNAGKISGMGIKKGVTLLVGGGYHGKSTLLKAIESGVYNHIPGDGREKCISNSGTVKVRSYSGRFVEKVDISTFIKNLPFKKNTLTFSTENASGSTSQAASIQEALEMDARVLLMDEDTCATNFLIRDRKMQKLVCKEDEPITTFIDKVKRFFLEKNISTILVLGGTGDYFDVSDKVIQMIRYLPEDVTAKAHLISEQSPVTRTYEDEGYPIIPKNRMPIHGCVDPYNKYNKFSVFAKEIKRINFGKQVIDLTDVEQLLELSQTKAISQALVYMCRYIDGKSLLKDIVDRVINDIDTHGLDILSEKTSGDYAKFRSFELAAALNRIRGLKIEQEN